MSKFLEDIISCFQARDVRGDGKRNQFYVMMNDLVTVEPGLALHLLPLVPEYGSWNDLFKLALNPAFKGAVLNLAVKQLLQDELNFLKKEPYSLLAKWAPRENKAFGSLAVEFAHKLATGKHSQVMASYRRRLSRLNAGLKTVETLECAGRWDEINPGTVPERALFKKRMAYLNLTTHGEPREPTNERRVACAKNFHEFLHNKKEPLPPDMEGRYEPVRALAREWLDGGWRV